MDTTTQLLMVASLARSAAGGQTETKAEVNEHRTLVVFGKGFVPADYTADKMHEYKVSNTPTPVEVKSVMVVDAVVAFRPGDVVKVNKATYHYYPAGFMAIIVKPDGAEGHEWGARYEVRPLNPQGSLPDSQWIHAKDLTLF
jgi:hypothetical protein